uniref:Integrase, catalytic region, zinc finger, CCHC-type, peptidase aspartic, catalytic n=1 Tax=Tanacetum cinerariifolium TaxID=118510 RepID=A0A699HE46_TANCI|nr:integrase, catalytic region, zinc finger, CCHC-type, peptidase aspartic, catalytic [Tanacetum cinerariifolium]
MLLTFADTHNMVAYLNKSDASEGFNQVIDFLNRSHIKDALTINPTIYVSCIKQFWNTVVIKQSNDVTRLQALVDKKKVVITEAAIRDTLHLDDAEGVDYLPNVEIFAELARMGYEKPSTKLTFYKAFFSSHSTMASAFICLSTGHKFNFSKYIFESLVRNVDSSSKFYMYPRFIQLIIQNQLGDLLTHRIKYISPALTQKVFANMRRVGKGCSGVEAPLFEGMLVAGEPEKQGDAEEQVQGNDNDAAQGPDTAVSGDDAVLGDDAQDQSIPSPTPPTPPPQQPQDIPYTSQEALDACAAFTRRVEHLEHDKVAQDLEITKLKTRVKKLERANKVKTLKLRRLKKVGTSQRIKSSDDIDMEDASNQGRMIAELDRDEGIALMDDEGAEKKAEDAQVAGDEQVKGKQAEIYQINMDHAAKVLSMHEDEPEVQEAVEVVTTAKLITEVVATVSESVSAASATIAAVPAATITAAPVRVAAASTRRRKGVVIRDPKEELTAKIPDETKSKDKGKEIMVEEPKPMKKRQQTVSNKRPRRIRMCRGQIKEEENKALESIDETPAQKAAKRGKLNEEVEDVEDLKQHLEIVPDKDDDVYTEATSLARKVPVVDYQIIQLNNKPRYKIIRADGTHQLYVSFITLLKNFDREDLESLWSIVKERFSTSKPNNYSDDYLLTTLRAMFGRPDGQDQVWKSQRSVHGQEKLILLVERRYPLLRFTLDQMLNAVRLQVEEQSEMSLELLSDLSSCAGSELGSELTSLAGSELGLASYSELSPVSYRTDYDSWSQRIRLYCKGKENGIYILQSIDHGPFELGTNRDTLGTTPEGGVLLGPERPRTYDVLNDNEKKRFDADVRATNIVFQGLPKDIYKLINHNIEAKAIWDNDGRVVVRMFKGNRIRLRGTLLREMVQLAMREHILELGMSMQNGVVLNEEELLFLTREQTNNFDADVDDHTVSDLTLNDDNIFQADECDSFDSDVDDEPTAQSIFMANLSSAGPTNQQVSPSNASILSEVHDLENDIYPCDDNQDEHEIHNEVQQKNIIDSTRDHIGVQNPFYLKQAQRAQPTLYDGNELLKTHHVPVLVPSTEEDLKLAETTRIKMNEKMNDHMCMEKRVKITPPNYSKENFMATFTPQTQLTPEQVFWSKEINAKKADKFKARTPPLLVLPPATVYPPNMPVHLVPQTLPTTSEVNIGLAMKIVFENLKAKVDQNAIDLKSGETERKNFLTANDNLIADCLSKDVFYNTTDSMLTVSRFFDMDEALNAAQKRIAKLESKNSNLQNKIQNDDHDVMVNHFSKLEVEHLNMQLKYQHLKESFENRKSMTSSDSPTFDLVFVIGQHKDQVQSRGNTIRELREKISRLTTKHSEAVPINDRTALDSQTRFDNNVSFEEEVVYQRLWKTLTHVLELSSCIYLDDRAWGVLNFDSAGVRL